MESQRLLKYKCCFQCLIKLQINSQCLLRWKNEVDRLAKSANINEFEQRFDRTEIVLFQFQIRVSRYILLAP